MRTVAHGGLEPANVYLNDPIKASVRLRESHQAWTTAKVQRISPLGIDVAVDAQAFSLGVINCQMHVQLTVAGQQLELFTVVVGRSAHAAGCVLLALRIAQPDTVSDPPKTRQPRKRSVKAANQNTGSLRLWACSEEFFPSAIGLNPARYNDYIYFKVLAVSAVGMCVVCSRRNMMLMPGLKLQVQMSLPMVGELTMNVRVNGVAAIEEESRQLFEVHLTVLKLEHYAREMIAQYLIQFGQVDSLDALRADGLNPASVAKGVDFYYLSSQQDLKDVLALRLAAHHQFGNLRKNNVCAQDLADKDDPSARILVGKHKGRVVASARIRFVPHDQPVSMEAYLQHPQDLPPREQMVEVSRACTDPEFRRGNLFANVVHQLLVSAIPAGRPYVLSVSLPNLLDFYKSIGCKELGVTVRDEFWNGDQHLMLMNAVDVCLGRDVSPAIWNLMFREPYQYLLTLGAIQPNGIDRLRLSLYQSIGVVTRLWFWCFKPKVRI